MELFFCGDVIVSNQQSHYNAHTECVTSLNLTTSGFTAWSKSRKELQVSIEIRSIFFQVNYDDNAIPIFFELL